MGGLPAVRTTARRPSGRAGVTSKISVDYRELMASIISQLVDHLLSKNNGDG